MSYDCDDEGNLTRDTRPLDIEELTRAELLDALRDLGGAMVRHVTGYLNGYGMGQLLILAQQPAIAVPLMDGDDEVSLRARIVSRLAELRGEDYSEMSDDDLRGNVRYAAVKLAFRRLVDQMED